VYRLRNCESGQGPQGCRAREREKEHSQRVSKKCNFCGITKREFITKHQFSEEETTLG
jgi:hypothetical protein